MINHLLKDIPKNAVKCNEPVEQIVWKNNAGNNVTVRTSSGVEYQCKHVMVTCSIGFLKEHWTDFFQPSLPAERIALYNGIGYGSITKVFIALSVITLFIIYSMMTLIFFLDSNDVRKTVLGWSLQRFSICMD